MNSMEDLFKTRLDRSTLVKTRLSNSNSTSLLLKPPRSCLSPHSREGGIPQFQQIKQEQFYIDKLRSQRQRMEMLKQQFDQKQIQTESLKTQLERLSEQMHHQRVLREKNDQVRAEQQKRIIELQHIALQHKSMIREYESLRIEQQEDKRYISELIAQNQTLRANLNVVESEHKAYRESLNSAHAELQNLKHHYSNQLDTLKGKYLHMKNDCSDSKNDNARLYAENKQLKKEIDQYKNRIQSLETDLVKQSERLRQAEGDLRRAIDQFEEYRLYKLQEYGGYSRGLESQMTALQDKMQKLYKQVKHFRKKEKESEGVINQINKKLWIQQEKVYSLREQLERQQVVIEKGKASEAQHIELIQKLRSELKGERPRHTRKMNEEGKLRHQLQRLRHELAVLRNAEVDRIEKVFSSFGIKDTHS